MQILIILTTLGVSGIVIAIYLAQRLDKAATIKAQTSEGRKELVENLSPKQVDFGVGTGFKFGFGFALGVSLALLIIGLISTIVFASFVASVMESYTGKSEVQRFVR